MTDPAPLADLLRRAATGDPPAARQYAAYRRLLDGTDDRLRASAVRAGQRLTDRLTEETTR